MMHEFKAAIDKLRGDGEVNSVVLTLIEMLHHRTLSQAEEIAKFKEHTHGTMNDKI